MPTLSEKLSSLIPQQLPAFVRDNNETFVAFLKAYYEYLEQDEEAQNVIQNARSYADVDRTIDGFVDYFLKQYAHGVPLNIFDSSTTEAKRFLTKYIGSLYRSKGSANALKLLFRLAFDEEIEVYYPNDFLLRPSDGKIIRSAKVRVFVGDDTQISDFEAKEIVGEQSGIVSSINSYIKLTGNYYDLYLDDSQFFETENQFTPGERLIFTDANIIANVTVLPVITDITANNAGLGYVSSDAISITPYGPGYFLGSDVQLLPNPGAAGATSGTPGVLPTNWTITGSAAPELTRTITANITLANGLPGIRLRHTRASGSNTQVNIVFERPNVALGDVVVTSYYWALTAGSLLNANINFAHDVFAANNVYLNTVSASNYPLPASNLLTRASRTYLVSERINNGQVAKTRPFISFNIPEGAVDFTIDVGAVQLEKTTKTISPTNRLFNSKGEGYDLQHPALLPYNWQWSNAATVGIQPQVTGAGTEDGLPYVDIRFSGVSSGSSCGLRFDNVVNLLVNPSETWSLSAYIRRVDGSTANITSMALTTAGLADFTTSEIESGSTNINLLSLDAGSLTLARFKNTYTFANASTKFARVQLLFAHATGRAIDVTLRIACPQFEPGSANTAPVLTTLATPTNWKLPTNWYTYDINLPQTPKAKIVKVDESGKIIDIEVTDGGASVDQTSVITIPAPTDTRSGTYTYKSNVAIISLPVNHGLTVGSNVQLNFLTGNLRSNVYTVFDNHTFKSFKVFWDGTTQNLFLHSENLANVAWTKQNLTVTSNVIANPITGTLNANLLTETSAVSSQFVIFQSIPHIASTVYTYSIYAKAAGRTRVFLNIPGGLGGAGNGSVLFDLVSANVVTPPGSFPANILLARIENIGNGWVRPSITYRTLGSNVSGSGTLYFADGTTSVYNGNTQLGVYLWGAQTSQGNVLLPYAPTTTSNVFIPGGIPTSGNVTLTYLSQANLTPVIGTVTKSVEGYGIDLSGQLDTSIVVQDSEKWQQYSYVIRTSLGIDRWSQIVKELLHPAGIAFFGEVSVYTEVGDDAASAVKVGTVNPALEAYLMLLNLIIEEFAVNVRIKPPTNEYYVIEVENAPSLIDSSVSRTSTGATFNTIDVFKFEYGSQFPINNIADRTIQEFTVFRNNKSAFQPPSFIESPNRTLANANAILTMSLNS